MGKTYHRGDNFKKARRDRNFKKSKKFKQLRVPYSGKPHQIQSTEADRGAEYEYTDNP